MKKGMKKEKREKKKGKQGKNIKKKKKQLYTYMRRNCLAYDFGFQFHTFMSLGSVCFPKTIVWHMLVNNLPTF